MSSPAWTTTRGCPEIKIKAVKQQPFFGLFLPFYSAVLSLSFYKFFIPVPSLFAELSYFTYFIIAIFSTPGWYPLVRHPRQCRWCGGVASKVSAEEIFDTVIRITAHDKFYSQLTPKCRIKCADAQYCITNEVGTGKCE